MNDERREQIRILNDRFRRSSVGGQVFLTEGIMSHGASFSSEVVQSVAAYDAFDEHNDPHGEHDFGAFDQNGERIFWKIDYYSPNLQSGSEDPTNPAVTTRVLTIMLAHEY